MRIAARRLAALVAVAALTVAGCGGSTDEGAPASGGGSEAPSATEESSPDDSASESAEDESSDDASSPGETEDDAVEVEVEIEDGQVTPSGDRVDVQVGQTIELKVDSDAADELHVHSTPEHTFPVRAGMDDKIYRFRVTQPGVVEVELHEMGDVVVTLAARP